MGCVARWWWYGPVLALLKVWFAAGSGGESVAAWVLVVCGGICLLVHDVASFFYQPLLLQSPKQGAVLLYAQSLGALWQRIRDLCRLGVFLGAVFLVEIVIELALLSFLTLGTAYVPFGARATVSGQLFDALQLGVASGVLVLIIISAQAAWAHRQVEARSLWGLLRGLFRKRPFN
jgi:hypothetical protein